MNYSQRVRVSLEQALKDRGVVDELMAIMMTESSFSGIEGTAAVGQLPTVGLVIDQHISHITNHTDATTITFNCAVTDWHSVTLGSSRILAVSNVGVNQEFTILLTQGGTGTNTVTWFTGILWAGGAEPTLTTTVGARDVFRFKQISAGVYLGSIVGQNYVAGA